MSFRALLTEFVRHAKTGDDLARKLFREGDLTHLERWLKRDDAEEIYKKIHPGVFNHKAAFTFIMTALRFRSLSEQCDDLNAIIGKLERQSKHLSGKERTRAAKLFAAGTMSSAELEALINQISEYGDARKFIDLDPTLSVRADRRGSRKKTIFCRLHADLLHSFTGKWHDAEVAVLCEIAFDSDDVTIDMVRSARRESTRKRQRR
jgi:hypothetical protein